MIRCKMGMVGIAALLVMGQVSWGHEIQYQAILSSESITTPSPGTGTALVTIDLDTSMMRVQADFTGLNGTTTASHIHCCTVSAGTGNAGVATPVPSFPGFPAGVTSGSYDQTFDLTDPASFNPAFVTANGGTTGSAMNVLLNGLDTSTAYLNIHTSTAPAGEIRGYFSPVPEPATAGLAAIVFLAVIGQTRVRRGC